MLINSYVVTLYHRLGLKVFLSELSPEVRQQITIQITYSWGI